MESIFTAVYSAAEHCTTINGVKTCKNYFDEAFKAGEQIGEATSHLNDEYKDKFIELSERNKLTQSDWFQEAADLKNKFISDFKDTDSVGALREAVNGLSQTTVLAKNCGKYQKCDRCIRQSTCKLSETG